MGLLVERYGIQFPRRQNANKTVDSICPCCFVTIATAAQEADLELAEREHTCRIERIAQLYPLCATSPCCQIDPRFGRFAKPPNES